MLLPVGQIDVATFDIIRRPVEDIYGRRTEIGSSLPVPKYAHNPTREQFHSSAILKRVEEARRAEWDAAVGITEADLFVPEVPYIFGEADRSTRSALISLRRLRPEAGPADTRRDILARRFISEVVHQIGLIRGLAHCPNNRCVMYLAAAVSDIDKRGSTLCANCRKRLLASD
jgi:archaemetzincin